MGTQKPNPPGQPQQSTPGKPGSRQTPDSNEGRDKDIEQGQDIPKTGRDPSEPIEQDVSDDNPTDDDEGDDEDEDETGNIELPADDDRLDRSRPTDNP